MRDFTFRLIVVLVTFSIGIVAVFFWWNESKTQYNQAVDNLSKTNQEFNQPNQVLNPNEEYDVYSAILSSEDFENSVYAINENTSVGLVANAKDLNQDVSNLTNDTIEDYENKKNYQKQLTNNFTVEGKIILLDEIQKKKLFKTGEIKTLYLNAKSLVTFSRIGFNSSKTQALVYVTTWCGLLCGQGKFVVLKKNNNKWIVENTIGGWVS